MADDPTFLTFRGDWEQAVVYNTGDTVTYEPSRWRRWLRNRCPRFARRWLRRPQVWTVTHATTFSRIDNGDSM